MMNKVWESNTRERREEDRHKKRTQDGKKIIFLSFCKDRALINGKRLMVSLFHKHVFVQLLM